jgi:tRNA threonylcarbamoyladenosine biosynthesis protein TsaB
MKIIGIDTATKGCSVSVVENALLLSEVTKVSSHTHAIHLMGMIDEALQISGVKLADVDGFAVTEGPGSFTGLRIGLSTAKGLAAAMQKPVVGVSSLRVLAMQLVPCPLLICPVLDARKNEVYVARYRYEKGELNQEVDADVLPPDIAVSGIHEPCIFVGDGATLYKDIIESVIGKFATFALPYYSVIRASTVAMLGIEKLDGKENVVSDNLIPYYIRRSDAERNIGKEKKNQ